MKKIFFLLFIVVLTVAPVHAYDNYPWINTALYENMKEPETYTTSEAAFVADHYDLAVGHLQNVINFIKQRNPDIKIISFSGLSQISDYYGQKLQQFLNLPANQGQYTDVEKEDVYIHYKCDVNVGGVQIKGCNYDLQTDQCSGQPAPGCSASTAQNRSQSRAPDWWLPTWLSSNYKSRLYKDFGPWRLKEILGFYPDSVPADGIWWDNVLYLPGYVPQIEKTIEYFGEADNQNSQHTRNIDYNNYYLDVKPLVEQVYPNARIWLGNVNGMYWIRQGGPYINWVLGNLLDFSPESWISPRAAGEYTMPSWLADCPDLKEVWTYTVANGKNLHVLTYNNPVDSNAQRTKIFSIIKYYLIKNSRLYYGYTEEPLSENGFPNNEWNKMAEINIGQPRINPPGVKDFDGFTNTDKFFDWLNPSSQVSCSYQGRSEVIAARHFENGLVIARWKATRCTDEEYENPGYCDCGPACSVSMVDPRVYSLSNPYGSEYYIVKPDGTLYSTPNTTITLTTNEAAVLLQVCQNGTVTATCGCNGYVYNPGNVCRYNYTGGNVSDTQKQCIIGALVTEQCMCYGSLVQPDGQSFCCTSGAFNPCDSNNDCNDNNATTLDICSEPSTCNAVCRFIPVQPACQNNDNQCPADCNYTNDNDCEQCINNDNTCTHGCDYINDNDCAQCVDGDSVCSAGCDYSNDNDCAQQCIDNDMDNYFQRTAVCTTGNDCNDANALVNPSAEEVCGNAVDENCDSAIDQCVQCSIEGQVFECAVKGCAGAQTCTNGYLTACRKNDLCCGVSCDDRNTCTYDSCNAGICSNTKTGDCSAQPFNFTITTPSIVREGEYFTINVKDANQRPLFGVKIVYGTTTRHTDTFGNAYLVARSSATSITAEYNDVVKTAPVNFAGIVSINKDNVITVALVIIIVLIVAAMAAGRRSEL